MISSCSLKHEVHLTTNGPVARDATGFSQSPGVPLLKLALNWRLMASSLCRQVPATADSTASPTHVAGSTCKAGDPCTVCHSEFEAEGKVVQLPCEHCFHEPCILPWLEMNHTCPVCRAPLPNEAAPRGPARQPGAPEQTEQTTNAIASLRESMQASNVVCFLYCLFL